jgi:xanthine dehydrogenase YagT iron-sulfur-binding subunit
MSSSDGKPDRLDSGVSRRSFLKGTGLVISVPLVSGVTEVTVDGAQVKVYGPGKVPVTLSINGAPKSVSVQPRTTLLDLLRNDLDMTGAKPVCGRAQCGACTVQVDGKAAYACSILAIDAQGRKVTTVESLEQNGKLHPVQQAFVDNDAQQCGFCTPGFVMACKAFLEKTPNPTPQQVERGLGGNLCRCGTYMGVRAAVAQAAKQVPQRGGRRNG